MFWAVLILTAVIVALGVVIVRIDKKAKSTYDKKFNPDEWQLPGHIELPAAAANTHANTNAVINPVVNPVVNSKATFAIKPSLYSDPQQNFYKTLAAALNNEFTLLTHVNAADVLTVSASNTLATQVALNHLTSKQFAFVVCDNAQLKALCVVDWVNKIDAQLKSACESAQLPLVSVNHQEDCNSQFLRSKILNALAIKMTPEDASNQAVLNIADAKAINNIKANGIELVLCPACSAVMLKRKAKNGESAGKLFWLCSTYPQCRGMLPVK